MRHRDYLILLLVVLGVYAGTRKLPAPSKAQSGTVHTQDYIPIPPGH